MPTSYRGASHHPVRPRAGRARDSVHRRVLRRVPAEEDGCRNRRPVAAPVAPDSAGVRPSSDDPGTVVPVSFKVAHEIVVGEAEPKLADLVTRLRRPCPVRRPAHSVYLDRRHPARLAGPGALPRAHRAAGTVGGRAGVRRDRRQDQEPVLRDAGYARPPAVRSREVRTHHADNAESKVYLSKKLLPEIVRKHRSARTVVQITP